MVAPSVCPKGYRLPPGIALVLGVLIGLSLLPVLKSLFGAQLFSCTCVSLCPNSPRNLTAAAQSAAGGEAGPFSSFIYPTWPSTELSPADFIPPAPKSKKRAVDEEVLWGYVPALDPRGLQRGLLHHGDPARLRRALHKLMSGQKTVVAAVGGSISVGRGSATQGTDIDTAWPSYLDQFHAWLRAAFPASKPELVNKAQSGSTSNIFDACAEVMVPEDADIVVVEFAMNDGTQVDCARDGSGTVPARGSFERLLRKLQALPNRPAVVVLNAYSFIRGSVGSYLKNAENEMSIIAAYYGLPTLSMRAAVFHQMLRNQYGYRVDRVRTENLESSKPNELFLFDISHPYGPTGHRYMAELLIGLAQLTAGSLQARPLQEAEHEVAQEVLPPPIIPGNYDKKAASCLMSRNFEDVVVEKKGFKWVNERPDAKSENDEKWGWIGGKPGDFVVLGVDSRSSGDGAGEGASVADVLLPVLNQRAHVILDSYNHLRGPVTTPLNTSAVMRGIPDAEAASEEEEEEKQQGAMSQGMGKAEVECISGCECETTVLDGWWERHASLQVMHTVMVTEHPKCRIKLTVLDESSGKGKAAGHKVKLTAALVLAGTSTEGLSKPGRLSAIARRR
ncbi:expressed protein [Chlorella variabilis]|uniref:Expressed protein n=1 Tax=Chlorella variabilis TaxID=554065 RepID=E1Z4F2_CHLVA|nr:expressed protein [Chlorella variabilis]EFN59047.1 expressed protein [Chlorella variabilis]|eukprot:XP_005851149.1 expressed protein [Chlorella variabilis]